MKDSTYLMNDQREAGRIASQVDSDKWVKQYLSPYLSCDATVLDVGCGPGHLAAQVAQQVSLVVGVDLHAERFPDAQLPSNLILQQGDANNLPFDDNKFDVSYIRFLLEYLPNKQNAVNEIVRVTKPGGIILLQDLDGQLVWHYPISDDLAQMFEEAMVALASTGFDPFVGRKLFSYLSIAKATNIQMQIEPYHVIAGTISNTQKEQWTLKLDIAKRPLTKLKSASFANKVCAALLNYLESPDTLTYSNVFTVVGTVT